MDKIPTQFRTRELIKAKGLTQQQLANRMGITLPALKQMLTAQSLTTYSLQKLAKGLDVHVWELLVSREEIVGKDASASASQNPKIVCPHCGKEITIHIEVNDSPVP